MESHSRREWTEVDAVLVLSNEIRVRDRGKVEIDWVRQPMTNKISHRPLKFGRRTIANVILPILVKNYNLSLSTSFKKRADNVGEDMPIHDIMAKLVES